ncbi:splicing factor 3B subunit 5/RDS3 complex subunit 10 [Dipodascopsis tothii]|uniref:splicing factor 3B subunit 5/RDS3 complex subunit 10 n=1 Tax=Dipodascopsis tothii TaxID=44089 RepID=UPI0034CE1368
MADKLRAQQQLEQLQNRYVGVGHADTTRYDWMSNVHRDTYASYVGHPPLLQHFAIALNEPQARVKTAFIEKMIRPCGVPPERDET